MNSLLRSLSIIAVAASLPIAVSAQSHTGNASDASGMGNTNAGRAGNGANNGVYTPATANGSNNRNTTNRTSAYGNQTAMAAAPGTTLGIQAISRHALDQQLTAGALTGKAVYDNQGKRVGKVKDVALDYATAPQLASSLSGSGAGQTSSGANTTTDMGTESGAADAGVSATLYGAAAVITPAGSLKEGNKLITLPLSQLNYDKSKDRLTVGLSSQDLTNLTSKNANSTK
ncbi:MAG TPA: PRC-barrel domain-containing protein [Opitutus sp.]|nr:PRC-barrel domain-containing protein [Opitutus sp.]